MKFSKEIKNKILDKKWYLIQFKTNLHHRAEQNLIKHGFETFIPLGKGSIFKK
jgi:membrane protein DedA with SNARE-associated domain